MKRSQKRLLVFELLIITILLLNSFVWSILNGYIKLGFIIFLLFIFKIIFNFEKNRHRYWKSICLEVIIYLLVYFLIYYISGLLFSFYKPVISAFTNDNMLKIIMPIVLSIIFKEILRYMMLTKSEGSKTLIILTCITFTLFDITSFLNLNTFSTPYTTFMFISLYLLPYISRNIVCTYISIKVGYIPNILYVLVMELYIYLLPIIPNPNEYIYSIYQLIMPFILFYRLFTFFKIERDEEIVRNYNKKHIITIIPATIIVIFLVYITSGYFKYHAIVIGSGSMTPNINKGDVVIIEKTKKDYSDIEIGQIIAYRYDNKIVVHRLAKKIKIQEITYFYTKGDNNDNIDSYKITNDMIVGLVNIKIPYIGYPTVWLNNL